MFSCFAHTFARLRAFHSLAMCWILHGSCKPHLHRILPALAEKILFLDCWCDSSRVTEEFDPDHLGFGVVDSAQFYLGDWAKTSGASEMVTGRFSTITALYPC